MKMDVQRWTKRSVAITAVGCMALANAMLALADNNNVYVSRFWHNHQPTYWPEWNGNGSQTERIQYAWDSIVLKPAQKYDTASEHPDNNLTDIFGLDDRRNAYQNRPRESLGTFGSAGGFALSYSGSLIDNVRSLGGAGQLGYGSGWWDGNRQASEWLTPSGSRRLDLVGFTYHHSLAPLLPKSVFRKELQIFKQAWWKAWNKNSDLSDHSKGYFPTEMAFSSTMIDVLVDEGYQWSIVASHHLSRTCPTYNQQANPQGTFQVKSSPPNKADQLGPSPTTGWWFSEPNPGNAAWNVSPYAYQLQKIKYVNPETGAEKTMIAVPSDDVLSYRYGYASEGITKIQSYIAPFANDSSRPVMVMPATDGDNAWGGGSSSWMEATPQLFNDSANTGYRISTPQDFVNAHGAAAPVAHIEDGAWIFPEMDYGSPYFLKWIEPPVKPNGSNNVPYTMADMETPGFALKFWSYAPLMAGANWCETAEQIFTNLGGSVQAWKIQAPYDWNGDHTGPNQVERAWHIYLGGLDSGFNYYGGLGNDDEVKPSLATRRAIEMLQNFMSTNMANDHTPPTVLKPQRFPYNPGWYTFGWFNSYGSGTNASYLKRMKSEFYIWTHAYDVSGVTNIVAKVRLDNDGANTLANNQNETYAGGSDVGVWVTIPMNKRVLPNTREALNLAANNSQIDYFITSPHIADYYFVKITDQNVPGYRGKLLDYYIEATDARGNTHKSEVQHVWVEDDGSAPPPPVAVTFSGDPRNCDPLVVTYNASNRVLQSDSPVYQQVSFDSGASWTRHQMASQGAYLWVYSNTVPTNASSATVWFENNDGSHADGNDGANWGTGIRDCYAPTGAVWTVPPAPNGCYPVTIWYNPSGRNLESASQVYIHVGHNGWQGVPSPDPAMRKSGNSWYHTYEIPEGTHLIDVVFNNGASTWDNNGTLDWHIGVTNCTVSTNTPLPLGVVITNLSASSFNVGNEITEYTLLGTAGSNVSSPHIVWNNSSGGGGAFARTSHWTLASVLLSPGTNIITVAGSNVMIVAGGSLTNSLAADSGSNSVYNTGWADGNNGGFGWGGAWILTTSSTNSGHFRATSNANPNLNLPSPAWGMWSKEGSVASAVRPLSLPLSTGQILRAKMENNWIQTGGSVGFGVQNFGGTNLFEFYFAGGQSNYQVSDSQAGRATDIPYVDSGWPLAFELTGASSYRLLVGTNVIAGTLAVHSDQAIRRLRFWSYNAGEGGSYDSFFNDISLDQTSSGPGSTQVVIYSASVTINRQPGAQDSNGDGIPDSWYVRYQFNPSGPSIAGDDNDSDGAPNREEWMVDTDPTNISSHFPNEVYGFGSEGGLQLTVPSPTTNSRLYDAWFATQLENNIVWTPHNLNVPGAANGDSIFLSVTNIQSNAFYRIGVKVP
ncbi:MAG TPA: hypothetical protein DCZ95_15365 [Verrucomicrobia bacterium]|nr:MAG: hypothetical protein A2X46_19120 [Lentisphaerae bacterium GWF2_57_35]HBA85464.1 hypothetical protein [Verrucomicrobiota bacterium]